ncbi:shikimate kinase [Gordonia sp. X0973]|uniref:shikimate kinase n=1 Tax=Gordonia sp. X0973 TaxID=2742602 RepID=UPI000F546324|nr:shikimate kinase [Gordonia sp. X0973]QKT07271.1 shikimate kinase [Gordonia sp. X0973]
MTSARGPVVVLTGFMGSGKSTVGRALAHALGVGFVDTDAEVERRSGRTIPEIFATDGEPAFRAIERDVVLDVLTGHRGVVALGGGSVTVPEIAAALAHHHVVYLDVTPEVGFARVAASDRPLLRAPDPASRYAALLADRVGAYRAVATRSVDGGDAVDTIVEAIRAGLPEPADADSPANPPSQEDRI